jgi:CheY-like chemotaxis protein
MANILVVDDYGDTASSTALWLNQFGYSVQIARDGFQAIEISSTVGINLRAADKFLRLARLSLSGGLLR